MQPQKAYLIAATEHNDRTACLRFRVQTFEHEQGCPYMGEIDPCDRGTKYPTRHWLITDRNGQRVGTIRTHWNYQKATVTLTRLVIAQKFRDRGFATSALKQVAEEMFKHGALTLKAEATLHRNDSTCVPGFNSMNGTLPLFERTGYLCDGDKIEESYTGLWLQPVKLTKTHWRNHIARNARLQKHTT